MNFLRAIILQIIFSISFSYGAEKIFILYNNDHKKDILHFDIARHEKVARAIQFLIGEMNPNIKVEILALNTLSNLPLDIANMLESDILRGIVFIGHGNDQTYAFNDNEYYGGKGLLLKLITETIQQNQHSENLLFYFGGCKMACGEDSFQKQLADSLNKSNVLAPELQIDTIAHQFAVNSNGGQYYSANSLDKFSVNTKIGIMNLNYQMLASKYVGGMSPLVMSMLTFVGVGLGLGSFELTKDFAHLGVLIVLAQNLLTNGPNKLGKVVNKHEIKSGYVYDLLKANLETKNTNCPILFDKTKS